MGTYRNASLDEWKAALVAAHAALCRGDHDAHVRPGESWDAALTREARIVLRESGMDAPQRRDVEQYVTLAIQVASCASTAPDGRVAGPSGLRLRIGELGATARRERMH